MKKILMIPGADAIEDIKIRQQCLELDFITAELCYAQDVLNSMDLPIDLNTFMTNPNEAHIDWFQHLVVATVVVQVAVYKEYIRLNGTPDIILSCSLGDLARNVCLGSASYATTLYGTYEFGASLAAAKGGISTHVTSLTPFGADQLAGLAKHNLEIGVMQTPFHFLVCGPFENVRRWTHEFFNHGELKLRPLYPFPLHSSLMSPSRKIVEPITENIPLSEWKNIEVYSAVSRQWLNTPEELRQDLLSNITSTVFWKESLLDLHEIYNGQVEFINLGPAPTLVGFHKKTFKDAVKVTDFFNEISTTSTKISIEAPREIYA